ncbi:MAG TPA: DUF1850 domain-containing protein [Clostridiales bacterium]|nr:DUF1850 domain-containing protein [Clostridiales bacterium]
MLLSIAALLTYFSASRQTSLILRNADGGEIYAKFPVEERERFSITFIHSVNKTPVTDVYEIRRGDIYVVQTIYYSFGAGVQTEIQEGQTLTYAEDGAMVVSGIDKLISGMIYVVGKIYDHSLEINGCVYSLTELCGKGSPVEFICK